MNRLINIGFISIGHWYTDDSGVKFKLSSHHSTKNVLYTFISNGVVKYIGKTSRQLNQRMSGYQNPAPTQTTNIRVNNKINTLLRNNDRIDIFILVDNGLLKYGNFNINLAAGLEDSLIQEINPGWNITGKKSSKKNQKIKDNNLDITVPTLKTLEIKLGYAYYNQGFFNISKPNSKFFGNDKMAIEIQLGKSPTKIISGYINRTANTNGTPRIMGGKEFRDWVQKNFTQNEIMKVNILSPVSVQLYK